jgi:predicted RNA methylase
MNPKIAKCRLQVEELERRDAPSTLTITPPTAHATPVTATVADLGCTNGIMAHAAAASHGVVVCS